MSFYIFQLDKLVCGQQRGILPDEDVVTFTVLVDQLDRGHGSGLFPLGTGGTAFAQQRTDNNQSAYPAKNRVNMSEDWKIGPLEILPHESVAVVYTGTNTSDDNNPSVRTQKQDELEIKVLNYVAKKYVELILGVEFGSDIGSLLSEGFDKAFKNPVGDLIGYNPQGPCNGPVFSGAVSFTGSELDQLNYTPLPGPTHSTPPQPTHAIATAYPPTYTDEATHDTKICGPIAETNVVFSVLKVSFISIRWSIPEHFPSDYPTQFGPGLRQYGKAGTTFSIKSLLGLRP